MNILLDMCPIKLLSLRSFPTIIFKEGSVRTYAKAHGIVKDLTNSWREICDPDISEERTVKMFKKYLTDIVRINEIPNTDLNQVTVLKHLINSQTDEQKEVNIGMLRNLNKAILQNRINNVDIYQAIANVTKKQLINVSVPSFNHSIQRIKTADIKNKPSSLYIHPNQGIQLDQVLNGFQNLTSNDRNGKPLDKIFEETWDSKINPSNEIHKDDIDVKSLKKYLKKEEVKQKQLRKLAWEENKKYDWNQPFEEPKLVSAGHILFSSRPTKNKVKLNSFIRNIFKYSNRQLKPHKNYSSMKKSKILLVYDLIDRSIVGEFNSSERLDDLSAITNQDLFAVINKATIPPEEVLIIINKIERDGWNLTGTLVENGQHIVFQKDQELPIKATNFDYFSKVLLTGMVAICISAVLLMKQRNNSQDSNSDKY